MSIKRKHRILVIDDERYFQDMRDATYARTLDEGFDYLTSGRWDEVYLDHDLGANRYGDDETVMPLVLAAEAAGYRGEPFDVGMFYVHSGNPVGAMNIMDALGQYYNVRRVWVEIVE